MRLPTNCCPVAAGCGRDGEGDRRAAPPRFEIIMGEGRRSICGLVVGRSPGQEEQVLDRRMPCGLLALDVRSSHEATMRGVRTPDELHEGTAPSTALRAEPVRPETGCCSVFFCSAREAGSSAPLASSALRS